MFGSVKDKLGDFTGKLTSWKGPESLDKVILQEAGKYVIQGFIKGLESEYGNVEKSLGGLTNKVSQTEFNMNPPTADFTPTGPLDSSTNAAAAQAPVAVSLAGAEIMVSIGGHEFAAVVEGITQNQIVAASRTKAASARGGRR